MSKDQKHRHATSLKVHLTLVILLLTNMQNFMPNPVSLILIFFSIICISYILTNAKFTIVMKVYITERIYF